MITVLRNGTYAKLFSAQVIALVGTGLLTVALGLLAFDIAGSAAGSVLGTALTIKMVAYVGVAPLVAALVDRLPKKAVLVGADLIRLAIATGAKVEIVWTMPMETPTLEENPTRTEAAVLLDELGGVGALLRFDPESTADDPEKQKRPWDKKGDPNE